MQRSRSTVWGPLGSPLMASVGQTLTQIEHPTHASWSMTALGRGAAASMMHVDGHTSNVSSLSDYHIPRFSEIPPIELAFLDTHAPGSPRGCGEMPLCPVPPAISNAVYDAVGVRFRTLPLTPERVKAALEA